MGQRVLEFMRQHPAQTPGLVAATARLQERLSRARQLAQQQLDGSAEMRVATGRKRDLRRLMTRAHLDHLARVAEVASEEEPELLQKFVFPPDATTYLAFRAAASGMAAEAEARKELLVKHGYSEEALTGLKTALDQFETALEQGAAGRLSRVAATAELVTVAEEIVQVVKVMNGLILLRFVNQPEVLAAWESATNVVTISRPEDKPVSGETPGPGLGPVGGGEVRPAA
jgi:hypothetical protein